MFAIAGVIVVEIMRSNIASHHNEKALSFEKVHGIARGGFRPQ
jgi:hypothetical protein